jgi:hypothetical protein
MQVLQIIELVSNAFHADAAKPIRKGRKISSLVKRYALTPFVAFYIVDFRLTILDLRAQCRLCK